MKVNKSQATMLILEKLLEDGFILKEHIISVLEISNLSFLRYIQEVKAFFYNFGIGLDVKYFRNDGRYVLIKR